jgi:hypothetical protein
VTKLYERELLQYTADLSHSGRHGEGKVARPPASRESSMIRGCSPLQL